jgi:uncharacterized protein (DUF1778 family)
MRLLPDDKGLLVRAAQIEGVKLGQFVLEPAKARAKQVNSDAETVTTSANGYRDLLEALANPPRPSQALVAAMRDYEAAGIEWR